MSKFSTHRVIALLSLLACCLGATNILSQFSTSYLPTDMPTYLSSPVIYNGTLGLCGLSRNGNTADSYCNDTVLLDIAGAVENFASNISTQLNTTITTLRDAFNNVGSLLWRRLDAKTTSLNGIEVAFEKLLLEYRRHQVALGREMHVCTNMVSRIMAGFLCAACNVTKNPWVIRPSLQPIIHLRNATVEAIQTNCTKFMEMVSGSVDYYHRTKMLVVDLLTAELGCQNHLCTCNNTAVNYTGLLGYNETGRYRELTDNVYTISATSWDPFINDTSMVSSDVTTAAASVEPETEQPYFVNNSITVSSDADAESYANTTLNSSGIYTIKGGKMKTYKKKFLSDFTQLVFAVGRIFNRTIQKRSFGSLYRELDELTDLSAFSYDEVRDMIFSLRSSYTATIADSSKVVLLFKLMVNLFINFLLKPPPSAYYSAFPTPNDTALVIAAYGAALLRFVKDYRYNDQSMGYSDCTIPYINLQATTTASMVQQYQCSGVCNLAGLAKCEAAAISSNPKKVIVMPMFRIMHRVYTNLTEIDTVATTLTTTYEDVSLVDQDFRSYIAMMYFPPFYYVINSDERKLASKYAMGIQAVNDYTNGLLLYLQEMLEDCFGYVKAGPKNMELLKVIVRTEKDVGREDQRLRKYAAKLESTEYTKLLNYELNRRSTLRYMKCMTQDKCKLGYVGSDAATVEVTVPTLTTVNPDYALMENRLVNGYMGMTEIGDLNTYNDEENLALARCARLFSARTLLCVEQVESDLLGLMTMENPPDYSALQGSELAAVAFTRHKLLGLLSFATIKQDENDDITQASGGGVPNDPVVIVDETYGLDLLETTGMNYSLNETMFDLDFDFATIMPIGTSTTSYAGRLWGCSGLTMIILLLLGLLI